MSLPATENQNSINPQREKFYKRLIIVISVVVFLVVALLSRIEKSDQIPSWAAMLPAINAFLNGTTFIILLVSFYFIKKKKIAIHKKLNLLACFLSTLFLISYIKFHSYGVETRFPAENPLRPFYLFILSSHILLAAIVLPLVLLSLYRGLTMQTARHRKIVKWSFPVWLYVTLTGVIVYLMISPYYKF